jgi:hypothetical protein
MRRPVFPNTAIFFAAASCPAAITDSAHQFRGHNTKVADQLKGLRAPARHDLLPPEPLPPTHPPLTPSHNAPAICAITLPSG